MQQTLYSALTSNNAGWAVGSPVTQSPEWISYTNPFSTFPTWLLNGYQNHSINSRLNGYQRTTCFHDSGLSHLFFQQNNKWIALNNLERFFFLIYIGEHFYHQVSIKRAQKNGRRWRPVVCVMKPNKPLRSHRALMNGAKGIRNVSIYPWRCV